MTEQLSITKNPENGKILFAEYRGFTIKVNRGGFGVNYNPDTTRIYGVKIGSKVSSFSSIENATKKIDKMIAAI